MSKKAQELAEEILDVASSGTTSQDVAVLIDIALVRERQACADRFRAKIEAWVPTNPVAVQIKQVLLTDGVEAILEGGN